MIVSTASLVLAVGSFCEFTAIIYSIQRYIEEVDKENWRRTNKCHAALDKAMVEWKKQNEHA